MVKYQGKKGGRKTYDFGLRLHELSDKDIDKCHTWITEKSKKKIYALQGKPHKKVTIYRGTRIGAGINEGDFITLDANVAKRFTTSTLGNKLNKEVSKKVVRANQIAPQLGAKGIYDLAYYKRRK